MWAKARLIALAFLILTAGLVTPSQAARVGELLPVLPQNWRTYLSIPITPRPTSTINVLDDFGQVAYTGSGSGDIPRGQTTTVHITPHRVTGDANVIATVGGAQMTGGIVFDSNRAGSYDVYVMNEDGSDPTQLTNDPYGERVPDMTSDGTALAFASNRDGNWNIFVLREGSAGPVRLTYHSALDYRPSWSPDGQKIAFATERDGNREIYVMNADGSGQTNLTNNSDEDWQPDWSPDGTKLAFVRGTNGGMEIWTMHADGSNQTRLTHNSLWDEQPAWCPDGTKIAFTRSLRSDFTNFDIYVMSSSGTGVHQLTTHTANDYHAAWSPDGTRMCFETERDGNREIYVMNADGTSRVNLTNHPAGDYVPNWWGAATHEVIIPAGPSGIPNPVASGGQVQCSVEAEDSLGHTLSYQWSAEAGNFDDATNQNPIWTAPENATDSVTEYEISVTATCSEGESATDSYTQQVNPAAHEVTITDGPSGDPNPVASGGEVQCSVEAQDSRGHQLTYEWSAQGDAGSFDDDTKQNPTWTAPANTAGSVAEYKIRVTATCSEGHLASIAYTQQVNPVGHEVTVTAGPAGDPNPVASGGQVQCSVTAEDSMGHALSYQWSAEGDAGSFDDATEQSPIWTAPQNTTGSVAEYEITVTITCAQGQEATESYTQQVLSAVPLHERTFSSGQRMIGIPVEVPGSPMMEDLLNGTDAVWWNPRGPGYITLGEPTPYVLGRGYWAQFSQETQVEILGTEVTGESTCDVQDGWNIVCSPYLSEIALDSILNAPSLWPFAWTDQGNGYELVAPITDSLNVIHHALQPWWGYWVLSDGDGTITWSQTSPSAQNVELLQMGHADAAQGGWQIQLTAQAGVADEQTAQALSIANPPPASGSVDLYFPNQAGPMATDIRSTSAEKLTWDFEVRTDLADTEVIVGYPDLSVVPNDYRLTLTDLDADKSTYMRTTAGYTYNSGLQSGVRHFRITAAPQSEASLLVTGVTTQQVNGQQAAITYTLSAAAQVDIQVRNIAGRVIHQVQADTLRPAGGNTAPWNLTNASGSRVPAGRYLCVITACTEDGQHASCLRPLILQP